MHTQFSNTTIRSQASNTFAAINEAALEHVEALMDELLPDGKFVGEEYQALNPHREDYELGSFSINCTTGLWCDFADEHPEGSKHPAKGSDLISLVAYVHQFDTQSQAKHWLEALLEQLDEAETVAPVRQGAPRARSDAEVSPTLVMPVPESAPPMPTTFSHLGGPSHRWCYKDEQGRVMGYILRFDLQVGKKEIRPLTYHVDASGRGEWKMSAFPDPRPLYNLDLLAADQSAGVVLVEGEKSADAAADLFPERVAMTVPGGANAVGKTNLAPLAGRDVLIWPDADEPGQRYASELVKRLHQLSPPASIKLVKPIVHYAVLTGDNSPKLVEGFQASQGWDAADAVAQGWTAEHIALLSSDTFEEISPACSNDSARQPRRIETDHGTFEQTSSGIYYVEPREKKAFRLWLCGPLEVVARTRSLDSTQWGLMLRFKDNDGCTHTLTVPAESLPHDGWRKDLLNHGFFVAPAPMAKDRLMAYLMSVPVEARVCCFDKIGWHNDVFLLPEQAYGKADMQVVLQDEGRVDKKLYAQNGTLEDWQRSLAALCEGNSRLTLAVCAALAGPFLQRLGLENGGFHFRGNSSIGKTITLQVAGSVWGGKEFIRLWRATANGLEAVSMAHNDTVLLLDEMSQVAAHEVGEIAYMLGNGKGKVRARRSGAVAASSSWRFLFLSTGEVNLSDHLISASKRVMAGQEARLLDIPADAGKGYGVFDVLHGQGSSRALAEQTKSNAGQFFGTAGPALLERLTQEDVLDYLEDRVHMLVRSFIEMCQPDDADGQVLRALNRFALVAAVGEFCIELGVLPWQAGAAFDGIQHCFVDWLQARGGKGNLERTQILAQVTELIERFGESRFTELGVEGIEDGAVQSRSNDRLGFKILNEEGVYEYFVLTSPFKTIFCKGFNQAEVVKVLTEAEVLLQGADGPSQVKRFGCYGTNRVYQLRSSQPNVPDDQVACSS